MSSLWWLCTAQWRKGKSRVRPKGKGERGQGGIACWAVGGWERRGWQDSPDMAKAKMGLESLRKGWSRVDKGVRRREGRGQTGSGQGNMGWVAAWGEGTEHHPVGHCGPITKTLSAIQWAYQPPFHTSLINWEKWEEVEGRGKGMSLYQPSKCQKRSQGPELDSWIGHASQRKWEQF